MINLEEYLTLKEWAKREGIQEATARQRCIRGATPATKYANRWLIHKDTHLTDGRKTENK